MGIVSRQRTIPTQRFVRKTATGALVGALTALLTLGPLATAEHTSHRAYTVSLEYREELNTRLLSATPAQQADVSAATRKKRRQVAQQIINEQAMERVKGDLEEHGLTPVQYASLVNTFVKGDPIQLPTDPYESWGYQVLLPQRVAFWLLCMVALELFAFAFYVLSVLFERDTAQTRPFIAQLDWRNPTVLAIAASLGPFAWLCFAISWRRYQEYLPAATRRDRPVRTNPQ